MKRALRIGMVASCALLVGCNAVSENVVRANQKFQSMIHTSAQRVQSWTDPKYDPLKKQGQYETRYCYKSLGDIVCYERPQPGMSNPLFGVQGYAEPQMVQTKTVMMAPAPAVSVASNASGEGEKMDIKQSKEPLALMPRQ